MARCTATLELDHPNAQALAEALNPDNLQAPSGVVVACEPSQSRLTCVVTVDCSDPRGILRLRNTLDDLILNLRAAASAIEASTQEGRSEGP